MEPACQQNSSANEVELFLSGQSIMDYHEQTMARKKRTADLLQHGSSKAPVPFSIANETSLG